MAVLNLDLFSYELAMNTQATIILPERRGVKHLPRNGESYPVLYLLHGHGQDHTSWIRMSNIERYLANTDVIVVMPNGNRGSYVDGVNTHRYGTYLTEELPVALRNWFHISEKREDTFIAGMSMGGYGAIYAAMKHPDKYAAAVGLSTAVRLDKMPEAPEKGLMIPKLKEVERNFRAIYGPDEEFEESDFSLKKLAKELQTSNCVKPRILQLCGDQDPLRPANDDFADFMRCECPNIPHDYQVRPGIHDFVYWDKEISVMLEFFGLVH